MTSRTAAPLDLAAVERVLRPYQEALTLPPAAYASPEVFDWEIEHFFEGSWMCIGRVADLGVASPGDQVAVQVGRQSFLLVRGDDGAVRAFHNICRHRGHELLQVGEQRTQRGIKCPYHAWVFGLDGDCRATPRFDMEGFDKSEWPLMGARLEEWHGWLFLNASGDAGSFEEQLGNLEVVIDGYRPEDLRLGARHEYELAANWKIVVENYHECLHCPTVHPELVRIMPLYRTGEVEEEGQTLGNSMGELTSFTASGLSSLPPLPGLDDVDRHTFYGVYVFPNLILNYHSETVNTVTIHPLGPDRTRVVSEFLFHPATVVADGFDPSDVLGFRDLVAQQDWEVCERAQAGVRSRYYTNGWYPRQERWIAAFNERYLAAREDA